MSGHSHWSRIRHKKAVVDARRGKAWGKLARAVTMAAKGGGGNPDDNSRLRLAIDKARADNMPKDTIEKAIKKGTGELEGVNYEEITYEGYGPGGVALFIETLTDNGNRTVADIRHALGKHGGSLGTSGSVAWQFARKGRIYVSAERHGEDAVIEAALEGGAEDIEREGEEFVVTTEAASFDSVQDQLREAGLEASDAELTMVPQNEVAVAGKDAEKLLRLLDALDDLDDIQKVHSNADIDEALLAEAP